MIQNALGKQRIQLLVFMLLLNAALIGSYYYYIQPFKQESVRELRNMRADANQRRAKIRELRLEFAKLMPKIGYYQRMRQSGFFNDQKRTIVQDKIKQYRDRANLLVAKYSIDSAEVIDDPDAKEAGHVILSSPVTIEMEALDDIDIYTFINLMQKDFPGNMDIRKITVERKRDIKTELLQNVASGEPKVLMEAEMQFRWRSMIQESKLDEL